MRDRLTVAGLVAVWLAAIVAANLTLTHWGPDWIIYNAFLLIGLDFATRDLLASFWKDRRTRYVRMAGLIVAGGALSYWLNRGAAQIAFASTVAFIAAETVEAIAYQIMRRQPWSDRAPKSALFAAVVDSLVFPTLAFHQFVFALSFGQFCAKLAGATFWAWVIARTISAPIIAPEFEAA